MIDDEGKARRLARAVCADVMLYNASVKDAPLHERATMIAGPVHEGRALYASRVSPALHRVLDEAIAELIAQPLGLEPGALSNRTPAQPLAPAASAAKPLAPPEMVRPDRGGVLVLVVAVLILIAAAAAFLLLR